MARFTSVVDVAAPVDVVWNRLTDWPRHGDWIPLTTVRVTSDRPDGVGAVFVARTSVGPLGFDDPMEVVEWTPPEPATAGRPERPGRCAVRKLGRVLRGSAWFTLTTVPGGSRVEWTEDVELTPVRLTRLIDPVIAAGARRGFERSLQVMARELEAEVRARPSGAA